MRRLILAAALASGIAAPAKADTIRCTFTEPFIVTSFDIGRGEMTIVSDLPRTRSVQRGLSLHLFRNGLFEIRDVSGAIVQHLEMTMKGADGMSEKVYPFDVVWPRRGLRGGCVSDHLPLVGR